MSKESYARGFCKAAEDAGVDPVELAKYAQQEAKGPKYKTDGWAPNSVSELGMDVVPGYDAINDTAKALTHPIPFVDHAYTYSMDPELTKRLEYLQKLRVATGRADPRSVPFLNAYNEVMSRTAGAVASAFNTGKFNDFVDKPLRPIVPEIFHKQLFRLTNGVPAKVTADVKKK